MVGREHATEESNAPPTMTLAELGERITWLSYDEAAEMVRGKIASTITTNDGPTEVVTWWDDFLPPRK
jgi:hypothetical protein